jgi:hypothetical protein
MGRHATAGGARRARLPGAPVRKVGGGGSRGFLHSRGRSGLRRSARSRCAGTRRWRGPGDRIGTAGRPGGAGRKRRRGSRPCLRADRARRCGRRQFRHCPSRGQSPVGEAGQFRAQRDAVLHKRRRGQGLVSRSRLLAALSVDARHSAIQPVQPGFWPGLRRPESAARHLSIFRLPVPSGCSGL